MERIMFFSVIVTIYNVEQYLRACVDSVLCQTYTNFEVILVDDGSTDRSASICDNYRKKDKRVRVIHKDNGGATSARITGIEKARGEYTIYVDGDDWIESDELMQIYHVLKDSAADMVEFGFYKEYEGLRDFRHASLKEGYYDKKQLWEATDNIIRSHPCFARVLEVSLCCKAVRTGIMQAVLKNINQQIVWGEDTIATFELMHEVEKIYIIYKPLYHYRVHKNSVMHSGRSTQVDLIEKQLAKTWNRYKKSESINYLKYIMNFLIVLESPDFAIKEYVLRTVTAGARLVIFGRGVFANGLMEVISHYSDIKVVDMIDSSDLERILEIDYDEIFIAITVSALVENCIAMLREKGVNANKIKYLTSEQLIWPIKLSV